MEPQRPAATLSKNLEIATGLRGLYDSKRVLLPRHRNIHGIIARDLQENARVRPALIGLPRGGQEARPKSETGGNVLSVTHGMANLLQHGRIGLVHFKVSEDRKVVAGPDAIEMSTQ